MRRWAQTNRTIVTRLDELERRVGEHNESLQELLATIRKLIAQRALVEVLPSNVPAPMPLSLIYANRRNLSGRVRVVMDWLAVVVGAYLRDQR